MRNIFYVILCTFYFTNLISSTTDTVESEWIDPGDMLRSSKLKTYSREQSEELSKSFCSSVSEKLTLCKAELLKKNCSEKLIKKDVCDGPYVKMIARSLVQKLSSCTLLTSEHYFITIALTSSQVFTLINFIEAKEGNIHDVSHVLSNMIEKSNIKMEVDEGWNLHLIDIFGISLSTFLQILAVFTLCALFIFLQMRVRISWIQIFFQSLILLFFISIPWNWFHMYKKALAKKHSDTLKIMPKECQPEDLSLMQTFGRWLRSTITLTVSKTDACTQYHEALLVDPFWEVAPTQAIAVTITKFIVQPFEHIGEAFNKFLRGTLDGLPAHISLIVLLIFILLIVLVLIMLCSYSVRVPFLGGLEPCHMPLSIGNEQNQCEVRPFYQRMKPISRRIISSKIFGKYIGKKSKYLKSISYKSNEKEL